MARPIKETPILKGNDAKKFSEKAKENETKKVSLATYERMMSNYKMIKG